MDEKDVKIEWRKIYWTDGSETKYSVSNTALVRNDKTGKILKQSLMHDGYMRIRLNHGKYHRDVFVHRLVATAFIPNPDNKPEVNHINGRKSCNFDYNLEWATREENQKHAVEHGLVPDVRKSPSHLSDEQVVAICEYLEENKLTFVEIAKRVGTNRTTVADIYRGKRHTDISHQYDLSKYQVKTDYSRKGDDSVNTKYSDKQIENLCELIDQEKYGLRELSVITNIDYQTIRNVYYGTCRKSISSKYNFMKYGVHPIYIKKRDDAIHSCELLDQGFNTKEVAEKLGISRPFVRKICSGESWRDISKDYDFMKKKLAKKNK